MVKQGQISLLIPSTIFIAFLVVPISAKNPLFIFGDSILDAGNNNYIQTTSFAQANFYPYGITFFNFPTGRFSDGRLICDFIGTLCLKVFLTISSDMYVKEKWNSNL